MKKYVLFAVALLSLVGCKKEEAKTVESAEERVELVKTRVLTARTVQREIQISTNLQGYQTLNVAPSLQGKIEHIYVEVGDKVRSGEDLVRMDQNQVKTTRIAMANLKTELARMEALLASGSVSQQSYDQLKLSYDQTRESLDFLEKNTYYKAPFAGVISAKTYEDGELYGGQPIVVLTQINKLKALIAVPETYYPLLSEGKTLEVRSEIYPDKVFPATIEVVYPTIDAQSHTFQCKVAIPNADELLRPGMYVTTTLSLGEANVLTAPYQAVEKLVGSNDRFVFLNENGKAKRVGVKLGQRFDEEQEIIADEIVEGVELVVVGQRKLVDGVKLNVVE